jgi:UDP:flavonoid glycosyltransferase YjiC (YdhE family)
MRVLWCTTPMEGVFGPFVPLGRALLAAGHDVIVATGVDLAPRVRQEGFMTAIAGPTATEGAIAAMADAAVVAAPEGEHWHFAGAMFGEVIAPAKLPMLRDLADEYRPDLIAHPPVDLAAPLLAAERGLVSVTYGFGQPLEAAVVAAFAERVATLWSDAGLDPDPFAGIYRGRYLDPCPPSLQRDGGPAVANTEPIRPEIPGSADAPLPAWAEGLGDRPVVYISLGTVPFFNRPDTFVTLLALLAREDLDLVVTISDLNEPTALGPQPPNVHVERWLPLAPLLPRCDAVVCHAGSGTTLAALTAGLPLVLVPQGADQHANAEACRRAGAARVLDHVALDSGAVRDAVMGVLDHGSPEAHVARRIAAEIAAMPPAESVVRSLDRLVAASSGSRTTSEAAAADCWRSADAIAT